MDEFKIIIGIAGLLALMGMLSHSSIEVRGKNQKDSKIGPNTMFVFVFLTLWFILSLIGGAIAGMIHTLAAYWELIVQAFQLIGGLL